MRTVNCGFRLIYINTFIFAWVWGKRAMCFLYIKNTPEHEHEKLYGPNYLYMIYCQHDKKKTA
jgi:hypothetical protein